ncbi:FxsA family protein [Halobacterium zhouii]|uniref:FxsA family protein n=1 Tax=Halobacterium zhouii TaxID=2902624 RepID=UPI001E3E8B29|nr:FxsA family protein [Halobacterium zhouii]
MRLRWLFVALLVVPLADALFLVFVAGQIGWELTVALVVLTALLGTLFVRAEGRATIRRLQQSLAKGEAPTDELVDGGLLIAAGAFLLTPGLVTDALGFLLVIPVTRIPIRYALKRWVITPKLDAKTGGFATGNVYTFGFPGNDGDDPFGGAGGAGPFGGGGDADAGGGPFGGGVDPGDASDSPDDSDTVDLGEDAYDVDVDDDETR